MTKNFPDLVTKTDMQVQEAQRVPNKMNPNRPTPRHIIIKMPKIKDKERIWKVAREKQLVTYMGTLIRQLISQQNFASQKGLAQNIQSDEKQEATTKVTLLHKAIIQNWRYKELLGQEKAKGVHHHQTGIIRDVKGTSLRRGRKKTKNVNNKMAITTYLSFINKYTPVSFGGLMFQSKDRGPWPVWLRWLKYKPKSQGFGSRSGHMPRFGFGSQSGLVRVATHWCFSLIVMFLSPLPIF